MYHNHGQPLCIKFGVISLVSVVHVFVFYNNNSIPRTKLAHLHGRYICTHHAVYDIIGLTLQWLGNISLEYTTLWRPICSHRFYGNMHEACNTNSSTCH